MLDFVVIFSKIVRVDCIAECYSSTVLLPQKLNVDVHTDSAILHSHNTNAEYSPYSDCSNLWLILRFYVNEINFHTRRGLRTKRAVVTA